MQPAELVGGRSLAKKWWGGVRRQHQPGNVGSGCVLVVAAPSQSVGGGGASVRGNRRSGGGSFGGSRRRRVGGYVRGGSATALGGWVGAVGFVAAQSQGGRNSPAELCAVEAGPRRVFLAGCAATPSLPALSPPIPPSSHMHPLPRGSIAYSMLRTGHFLDHARTCGATVLCWMMWGNSAGVNCAEQNFVRCCAHGPRDASRHQT